MFGLVFLGASIIWALVCLFAGIMAMRGRSFWATRMMVAGGVMQVIGGLFGVGMMFIAFSAIGGPAGGSGSEVIAVAVGILTLLAPAGTLVFVIGLVGLSLRYGAVEKRAAELEVLTEQLGARLQE